MKRQRSSSDIVITGHSPKKSPSRISNTAKSYIPTDIPPHLNGASISTQETQPDPLNSSLLKACLHLSYKSFLSCRDTELMQLRLFLSDHIDSRQSASLYVSGPPGTGKTACVKYTLSQLITETSKPISKASKTKRTTKKPNVPTSTSPLLLELNCMQFNSPTQIYHRVIDWLLNESSVKSSQIEDKLKTAVTSPGEMAILVLDEVDSLALNKQGQSVLYSVFSWTSLQNSRIIIIGIANVLDLTDRLLPRLQSKAECNPIHILFCPYTYDQLYSILQSRLDSCENVSEWSKILHPDAVKLCARKVASVHGDVRKSLDVLRRALELWEGEQQRVGYKPSSRVTVVHISFILSQVFSNKTISSSAISYSSTANGLSPAAVSEPDEVPIHQKITVCTLLLIVKTRSLKQIKLGALHDKYSSICRERHLTPLSQSDFVDMCRLLESRAILEIKASKEIRMYSIRLTISETEVEHALKDHTLISSILNSYS